MKLWTAVLGRVPFLHLQARTLILTIVLGTFFVFHLFSVPDPDYYWHLRTGQYILENSIVPSQDPFSYTATDRPWIVHEWGSQIILYWLDSTFTYSGVVLFFSILTTVALFVQHRLLLRLNVNHLVASVLVFVQGFVLWPFFSVRPLTFSWLLLSIYLLLLYSFHRGQRVRLWLLPLLMVIWVNLHGGFIIGLVATGLLLVTEVVEARLWGQPHRIRLLGVVFVITALATMANPSAGQGVLYPLSYLGGDNASFEYITEWQSPNFHEAYWLITIVPVLLAAMALGLGRRTLGLWPFLLTSLVTVMALHSVRNVPIFGLAVVPVLGEALRERLPWVRPTPAVPESPSGALINWILLVVLAGTTALIVPRLSHYHVAPDPFGAENPYPEQGATFLASCYTQARMFNLYWWGGYLLYRLYPEQRVFIDGRADLYGSQLLREYMDVAQLKPQWRDILDQHQIDLVIFPKDHPLTIVLDLDPSWKQVFVGPVEAIYVRTGGGIEDLIESMPPECTGG